MLWKIICKGMKILFRPEVSTYYRNCEESVFYNMKCDFVAGMNCVHKRYPICGIRRLLESKPKISPSFGEAQFQFSQFGLKMVRSNVEYGENINKNRFSTKSADLPQEKINEKIFKSKRFLNSANAHWIWYARTLTYGKELFKSMYSEHWLAVGELSSKNSSSLGVCAIAI